MLICYKIVRGDGRIEEKDNMPDAASIPDIEAVLGSRYRSCIVAAGDIEVLVLENLEDAVVIGAVMVNGVHTGWKSISVDDDLARSLAKNGIAYFKEDMKGGKQLPF